MAVFPVFLASPVIAQAVPGKSEKEVVEVVQLSSFQLQEEVEVLLFVAD